AREGQLGIGHDRHTVPLLPLFTVAKNGEAIIGRSHPGSLDRLAEDIVEERRFPGRMISDNQNQRSTSDLAVGETLFKSEPGFDRVNDLVIQFRYRFGYVVQDFFHNVILAEEGEMASREAGRKLAYGCIIPCLR